MERGDSAKLKNNSLALLTRKSDKKMSMPVHILQPKRGIGKWYK